MTCIVGLVHDNSVTIGGDSLASNGHTAEVRPTSKVFKLGEFAIGTTGSVRMHQVLRYHLKPPAIPDGDDVLSYMVVHFVEAVRAVFKTMAVATLKEGVETCGTFLVGVRGRLFEISADYQVGEAVHSYAATGSGEQFALGAMYATRQCAASPRERIETALAAAAEHSPWVRGPWHFVEA